MTTESGVRMARDSTEFQHKAILALDAEGFPRAAMADLLGISLRSIRRYLNTPCPAYAEEMAEREKREIEVARLRPIRAVTPFIQAGDHIRVRDHRDRILEEVQKGRSQAEIGRLLGISRRMVHYHLRVAKLETTEMAPTD
jgi:DNA-binding CsgD family transcriptional regulator